MEPIYEDNKDLQEADVTHIKEWISKQPHLPEVTDDGLAMFLHSCHYNRELTKTTIDTYYTIRTATPEFFSQRDAFSAELESISKVVTMCPLPKRTPEGYQIIFGRLKDPDPSHYFINAGIKILFMVVDSVLKEDIKIPGFVFLFDQKLVGIGHVARVNPISVKKYFVYIQEAMPVRLKAAHVINVSPVMSMFLEIMRPFMNKQQQEQLHLHTADRIHDLHKTIPQSLLPEDYGGDQPSVDSLQEASHEKLKSLRDWFKEGELERVDESKRRNNMRSSSDIFGVEGSFKRLDID